MTQYLSQLSLARLLAASLLLGIALGVLYDFFRIRRLACEQRVGSVNRSSSAMSKKKRFRSLPRVLLSMLLHIEDLFFGLIAGVSTAILYFALSMGQVRLMAIIGEGVGLLLYRLTLGRLVMACADRLLRLLAWLWHLLVRFVIRPPIRLVLRLITALARLVRRLHRTRRDKRLACQGSREAILCAERLRKLASVGFSEETVKKRSKDRKVISKRKALSVKVEK